MNRTAAAAVWLDMDLPELEQLLARSRSAAPVRLARARQGVRRRPSGWDPGLGPEVSRRRAPADTAEVQPTVAAPAPDRRPTDAAPPCGVLHHRPTTSRT